MIIIARRELTEALSAAPAQANGHAAIAGSAPGQARSRCDFSKTHRDLITHELGHCIGQSHGGTGTMNYPGTPDAHDLATKESMHTHTG